ncbi:hypothetical protein AVEN_224861-1, partial [Araneus ventricosus]
GAQSNGPDIALLIFGDHQQQQDATFVTNANSPSSSSTCLYLKLRLVPGIQILNLMARLAEPSNLSPLSRSLRQCCFEKYKLAPDSFQQSL